MSTPSFGQPGGTGPNPLVGIPAPPPPVEPLQLVATAGLAGFALQNGTPTIFFWLVPSDGLQHRFVLIAARNVTSAETGGQITLTCVLPGGTSVPNVIAGGGSGVGAAPLQLQMPVAPGSTVTLAQTSALTLGACTVYAELWGS